MNAMSNISLANSAPWPSTGGRCRSDAASAAPGIDRTRHVLGAGLSADGENADGYPGRQKHCTHFAAASASVRGCHGDGELQTEGFEIFELSTSSKRLMWKKKKLRSEDY